MKYGGCGAALAFDDV